MAEEDLMDILSPPARVTKSVNFSPSPSKVDPTLENIWGKGNGIEEELSESSNN